MNRKLFRSRVPFGKFRLQRRAVTGKKSGSYRESAGADCSGNFLLFLRRQDAGGREEEGWGGSKFTLTCLFDRVILGVTGIPRRGQPRLPAVTFLLSYSRGEVKFGVAGTFSTLFYGGREGACVFFE